MNKILRLLTIKRRMILSLYLLALDGLNRMQMTNFIRDQSLDPSTFAFTEQPDIKIRNVQGLTPFGYLELFLATAIIQPIVIKTNRFRVSKHGNDWEEMYEKDMWRFFALLILMGIKKKDISLLVYISFLL